MIYNVHTGLPTICFSFYSKITKSKTIAVNFSHLRRGYMHTKKLLTCWKKNTLLLYDKHFDVELNYLDSSHGFRELSWQNIIGKAIIACAQMHIPNIWCIYSLLYAVCRNGTGAAMALVQQFACQFTKECKHTFIS